MSKFRLPNITKVKSDFILSKLLILNDVHTVSFMGKTG